MKNRYINNIYINDYYSNKSREFNYISRSWFKINEINKKYNILNKNMNVIDLGSSPGGWSKYISEYINKDRILFSCDINNMKFISKKILFFKGNILNKLTYNNFIKFIYINKVNLIVSDMLSNISGIKVIDYNNNLKLINLSLKICFVKLKYNGSFIFKLLNNFNIINIFKKINFFFKKVYIFKPKSSRKFSSEMYIIAKNFKI